MKRWTRIKTFQKNGKQFRISKFQPREDKIIFCAGIKSEDGQWYAFTLDSIHYSDLEHNTAEAAEAHARRYAEIVYGRK